MTRLALIPFALGFVACTEATSTEIADPLAGGGKADGAKAAAAFRWEGPTNVFPAELGSVDANYNANHCELWLNGLGSGTFSNGGHTTSWLEAYISVPPQAGDEVLAVGMFARTAEDEEFHLAMLGQEIEPDYWRTGVTLSRTTPAETHDVIDAAFFVDVERDGEVLRFWQSRRGENFSISETFALPPSDVVSNGGGAVRYANSGAGVFDQKRACD
jgi:hypothetical protein